MGGKVMLYYTTVVADQTWFAVSMWLRELALAAGVDVDSVAILHTLAVVPPGLCRSHDVSLALNGSGTQQHVPLGFTCLRSTRQHQRELARPRAPTTIARVLPSSPWSHVRSSRSQIHSIAA